MIREPGTYALLFSSAVRKKVRIGKLGMLEIRPGYYIYVGSAFGPGGLVARVGRHMKISKKARWHIDYLRPHLCLVEVWFTTDADKREHSWARLLNDYRGVMVPLAGFGSSDCCCVTHFFYFSKRPTIIRFRKRLTSVCPDHGSVAVKRFL